MSEYPYEEINRSWDAHTLGTIETLLRAQAGPDSNLGTGAWRDSFGSMRDHFIDAVLPSDDYRWARWMLREHSPDTVVLALAKIGSTALDGAWRCSGMHGIRGLLKTLKKE